MLEKIVTIKNIGKFRDCQALGDVQFRKLTLLYAENGRGKTTLCDILRSLKTGDAAYIEGRHTLGSPNEHEVNLRLENTNAIFGSAAWSPICRR